MSNQKKNEINVDSHRGHISNIRPNFVSENKLSNEDLAKFLDINEKLRGLFEKELEINEKIALFYKFKNDKNLLNLIEISSSKKNTEKKKLKFFNF